MAHNDKLTDFFRGFDAVMKVSLGTLVKEDAMFYLAIFLVLQWHVRKYFADWSVVRGFKECCPYVKDYFDDPSETLKRVGLNIWMLQFYYDREDPKAKCKPATILQDEEMPLRWLVGCDAFKWTIILIFFDSVVLNLTFLGIGRLLAMCDQKFIYKEPNTELTEPFVGQKHETDTEEETLPDKQPATNLYMDITAPIGHVFMTMCVQLGLLGLYVEHLNVDPSSHIPSNVNYGFWLVGLLIQLFAADTALGSELDVQWWMQLLGSAAWKCSKLKYNNELTEISDRPNKIFANVSFKYKYLWLARFVMDWFVNGFGRTIILLTFPIMLCVEENIDFVKDCMGIFFITQLDDIETKDWVELMVRIKIRIAYQEKVEDNEPVKLEPAEVAHVKKERSKEYGDKYDNLRGFLNDNPKKHKPLRKLFINAVPEFLDAAQ